MRAPVSGVGDISHQGKPSEGLKPERSTGIGRPGVQPGEKPVHPPRDTAVLRVRRYACQILLVVGDRAECREIASFTTRDYVMEPSGSARPEPEAIRGGIVEFDVVPEAAPASGCDHSAVYGVARPAPVAANVVGKTRTSAQQVLSIWA